MGKSSYVGVFKALNMNGVEESLFEPGDMPKHGIRSDVKIQSTNALKSVRCGSS